MTTKCKDCGKRHRACGDRCLTCKTAFRRRCRDAEMRGWTMDVAGGGWWVWDRIGNVLGMGNTLTQALDSAEGR